MRNLIKFGFIFCAVLTIFSCKDMDSTYKDLLVPGGIKYPQKPSNVVAHSGEGKVQITWDRGGDPSITKAVVYWNDFTDSQEITISPTDSRVSLMLTNLKEKDYSFSIQTFDEQGNASVPVEINSKSYGEVYKSTIVNGNRTIGEAHYEFPNSLKFLWNGAESGLCKTQITYTLSNGETKTIDALPGDNTTQCVGYKPDTEVYFISTYKPDSTCLDEFLTTKATYIPDFPYEFKFDRSEWTAEVSSSHPHAGGGLGESLLDGKYSTDGNYWHSGEFDEDIWVSVDMKRSIKITRLIISSRKKDDWPTTRIDKFTLQGSDDGVNWEDIGDAHDVASVETDEGPQHLYFDINAAKFYKQFKIKMTHRGDGFIALGEVDVRGLLPE